MLCFMYHIFLLIFIALFVIVVVFNISVNFVHPKFDRGLGINIICKVIGFLAIGIFSEYVNFISWPQQLNTASGAFFGRQMNWLIAQTIFENYVNLIAIAKCKGNTIRVMDFNELSLKKSYFKSASTQSTWPPRQLQWRAEFPDLSWTLIGILLVRHSCNNSKFPLLHASCSGLNSSLFLRKFAGTKPSFPKEQVFEWLRNFAKSHFAG